MVVIVRDNVSKTRIRNRETFVGSSELRNVEVGFNKVLMTTKDTYVSVWIGGVICELLTKEIRLRLKIRKWVILSKIMENR